MATLIPAIDSCKQRMTPGERRFAERLESHLEEDYLLWYDVAVGEKHLHPDFIILHPSRGLFILEVKDWKLDTLDRITPNSVWLLGAEKQVPNPLEQARHYAYAVASQLETDPLLVQSEGNHQGKLLCPYGYGVVLTNITRNQFEQSRLAEAIDPNRVICRDEMYESVDPLEFQERIWNLSEYQFGTSLSLPQIDRIRYHLFPDVRIHRSLFAKDEAPEEQELPLQLTIPDLIQVMDLQQEQLARSLGEGHRVIHGVAGSGKTLILAYRCLHLAEKLGKPILVLSFNVTLAARLKQMMRDRGLSHRVSVYHFHGWCAEQLRLYHVPHPIQGDGYVDRLVQQVIKAVDEGRIPAGQYGAVMIDEGHDFQAEWLKLAVQMVDPETNSLLLLYDDAQSIYEQQQKRQFSFKSVGIQAQGRTTILRINYRNTTEVLTLAYEFAREVMQPTDATDEDMPVLVQPQSAGRHGPLPDIIKLPRFREEVQYLAQRFQQLHERGTPWNEMAIVYRTRFMAEEIMTQFQKADVPIEWLNQSGNSRYYDPNRQSIKLMTMHSSKGLEFPIVAIPGIGFLPHRNSTPEEEARLLYVAMTRAVNQLILTCDRKSEFVERLQAARQRVGAIAGGH